MGGGKQLLFSALFHHILQRPDFDFSKFLDEGAEGSVRWCATSIMGLEMGGRGFGSGVLCLQSSFLRFRLPPLPSPALLHSTSFTSFQLWTLKTQVLFH